MQDADYKRPAPFLVEQQRPISQPRHARTCIEWLKKLGRSFSSFFLFLWQGLTIEVVNPPAVVVLRDYLYETGA